MMIRSCLVTLGMLAVAGPPSAILAQDRPEVPRAGDSTAKAPAGSKIVVEIDTSDIPEAAEWAEQAKGVVEAWYPKVATILQSDGDSPPPKLKLVFKKRLRVPAYAGGRTITISGPWIREHPDDLGMVVHELTHLIQHYPRSEDDHGWLIEGIADYVRFFHYEPGEAIGPFDPEGASYRDSYRTSARFLAWIEKTHDKTIVATLNRACQEGKYKPVLFQEATGRTLDELWDEFVKASRPR
ncbi:basic secretory protein-like protein [Tundrisphaera lichenicola]|uniref:basic secretory protein-like protein n=1 Tax=Tundrisphaera lichenicola TaxID=2029860 RepID=UPI003EB9D5C7